MIRRSDSFDTVIGRRGNLLAVLGRHVTEGSRWLGKRENVAMMQVQRSI